jgi:hypothetical protein
MQTGMEISRKGLDKRFTESAVQFMRQLVLEILKSETPKLVFAQFKGGYLTDCSQTICGEQREKLAVRLELQQGQLQVTLEDGA